MRLVRILLAHGQPLLRRGLRSVLHRRRGWRIVGEAGNTRDAIAKAKRLRPHVAIVDIGLEGGGGLAVTREIVASCPGTQVVILTGNAPEHEHVISETLAAGARACVSKANPERHVVAAVRAVVEGRELFVARDIDPAGVARRIRSAAPPDVGRRSLSKRQLEIVRLIAEGKSNKEVAAALGISVRTAEAHRANAMHRLAVSSLGQLVRYAIRAGLLRD